MSRGARFWAPGGALAAVAVIVAMYALAGNHAATSQYVGADERLASALGRIDNTEGGAQFATAAEAHAAVGFSVPNCQGIIRYSSPRPEIVYGHFDDPDLLLSVMPVSILRIGVPPGFTVAEARRPVVHGNEGFGYEYSGGWQRLENGVNQSTAYRTYIGWNERGAGVELTSTSQHSFDEVKSLADNCSLE